MRRLTEKDGDKVLGNRQPWVLLAPLVSAELVAPVASGSIDRVCGVIRGPVYKM